MNDTPADPAQTDQDADPYRVLARKYRPQTFDALIGQEAMVRTLSNAIENNRLAHAFVLTGVRGVGKTTTARLIARALNCTGAKGDGGPTVQPCGSCESCRAIAESRDVDVLEMDAASHTGVDDIREIIDSARYAPVSSRYKIYIVDEVHMLSRSAFNALLKTLEEPPEHVKFIFATTEVRKVPVTVLSRCQRFDLRRIEADVLFDHLKSIAKAEKVEIEDNALSLIVRAAEGSVRDGLSLLDQAIAHGAGAISEEQVRDMLGLADRALVLDLFEAVMKGDLEATLANLRDQYNAGADPMVILQDLAELTHWLTRLKAVPSAVNDASMSEAERRKGKEMADTLAMPHLARAWQMLLKGIEEVRLAPNPMAAAEMALIRLAYLADVPAPADLVKEVKGDGAGASPPSPAGGSADAGATPPKAKSPPAASASPSPETPQARAPSAPVSPETPQARARAAPQPETADAGPHTPNPQSFEAVVDLVSERGEMVLHAHLMNHVRLVRFQPGRLEINVADKAPANLANQLGAKLSEWTGERWVVTLSGQGGEATLKEREQARMAEREAEVKADPLVAAALDRFEGARIVSIKDRGISSAEAPPTPGENEESQDIGDHSEETE